MAERRWTDYYLPADCGNCGRRRLEFVIEVGDGEHREEERLVKIRCEKCLMAWPTTSMTGDYELTRTMEAGD